MKKIILGLIIGLVVGMPVMAHAWTSNQEAKLLYGLDCRAGMDNDGRDLPRGINDDCSGRIYVFDDADNKCYVAKGANASGISCVKDSK